MTQPETNTGLLVEFDSVRMRSNLVLVAIYMYKLEAQWAEPVSLTFHSALRKHNIVQVSVSEPPICIFITRELVTRMT